MTDATPAAAPQQKSHLPKILAACAACGCLALCAFLGLAIGLPLMLTQGAVTAAQDHVRMVREGQVEAAYAQCSTNFKAATNLETFQAFVQENPRIYKSTELSFSNRKVENDVAFLEGSASGPEGTQPITVHLRKEGDAWRVEGLTKPE